MPWSVNTTTSAPTLTTNPTTNPITPRDLFAYLDTLNQEFTNLVLPAIVYLAVLMIIGIFGNGLVLYVYTYKTRTGTITRYIQALAVFDLLSCCLAMPGEIADMIQNYTFGRNPVCKVVRTVNLFCTMASGVTLVVVAIDRHKRICSPMKDQISPRGAYIIVIICAGICGVLSLPSAAIFGSRTIPTRWDFVNGTDCSISDRFIDTAVPLVYNSFQMLLFFIGAVIITVLYFFVGRTIFRQAHLRKVRTKRRNSVIIPSPSSPLPVSDRSTHSSQDAASNPEPIIVDKCPFSKSNTKKQRVSQKPSKRIFKTFYPSNTNKIASVNATKSVSKPVEIELSSTTTASPPETPIDQQYFDYKPLIKMMRTQSQKQKHFNGVSECDRKGGAIPHMEQLNELTLNEAEILASHHSHSEVNSTGETSQGVTRNVTNSDEIISGNLTGLLNVNIIEKCKSQQEQSPGQKGISVEIPSSLENKSLDFYPNSSRTSAQIDCLVNKKKYNIYSRHDVPSGNMDADYTYGDIGSQEKLRWSVTTMMMSRRIGEEAFPEKKQVLFRSNSDVGCRPKGGKLYNKNEPSRRTVTSDDEGNPTRMKVKTRMNGNANGCTRRYSSFKRFKDLKKLSISDPQGTRRTTLMLFLISLIYVLSFLPHLLLMIIKVTHPNSLSGEGGSVEVAHNILLRSYFINSVANPIIYSFCSRDFLSRCLGRA